MKKQIAFLLIFALIMISFGGCAQSDPGNSDLLGGLGGLDAVKLLLANTRLNSESLAGDDFFEGGAEAMNNLAATAYANLGNNYGVVLLSNTQTRSSGYTWDSSDFQLSNNGYGFFQNRTEGIAYSATRGAQLIDFAKKNVRVVGKWVRGVSDGGVQADLYLSVTDNSEMIISVEDYDGMTTLSICRRYKNEAGLDVYELYFENGGGDVNRITYIPGLHYESYEIAGQGDGSSYTFIADKSKGYWETYMMSEISADNYNVMYLVMKDDICYQAHYDEVSQQVIQVDIMSSDRKATILSFQDGESDSTVILEVGSFNGISSISVDSREYVDFTLEQGQLLYPSYGKLNLNNGATLAVGDMFVDGAVLLNGIYVVYTESDGYMGSVHLNVLGDTQAQRIDSLKQFMSQYGISCKYDFDGMIAGVNRAYKELEVLTRYYQQRGVNVSDTAGLVNAVAEERKLCRQMYSIYADVKNAEAVEYSDQEAMVLNMSFSPVVIGAASGVQFQDMTVSADSISLTAEDTLLFVNDEKYTIRFALDPEDGQNTGLIHLDVAATGETPYADEKTFSVAVTDVSLAIPVVDPGTYTLVAYISTADGIRSSDYIPVTFDTVTPAELSQGNLCATVQQGAGNTLQLTCVQVEDVYVSLEVEELQDHQQFRDAVMSVVNQYGVPDGDIEKLDAETETFTTFSQEEGTVGDGVYRVAYNVVNGDHAVSGHIYIQYQYRPAAE